MPDEASNDMAVAESSSQDSPTLELLDGLLSQGIITALGLIVTAFFAGAYVATENIIRLTDLTWTDVIHFGDGEFVATSLLFAIVGVAVLMYGVGYQSGIERTESDEQGER